MSGRFSNKRSIKELLYSQLKKFLSCSNLADDLQELMVKVDKVVRHLKRRGENISQEMILIAVEKKLPKQLIIGSKSDKEKREGVNTEGEQSRETEQLLRDLEGYIKITEETDALAMKDDRRSYTNRLRESNRKDHKTVVTNIKASSTILCRVFCGQTHYNDMCSMCPSSSNLLKRVFQLRLCFKCLKEDHSQRSCNYSRECFLSMNLSNFILISKPYSLVKFD